jgi:hypothetical protein
MSELAPRELMGAGESLALGRAQERDLAPAPALSPGGLEHKVIALVGVARLELQRLLAAQPKGGLQLQAQADMGSWIWLRRSSRAHALLSLVT